MLPCVCRYFGHLFLTGVAPPFVELFYSPVNCRALIVMPVVLAYRNADKLVWWNRMDHHCGSSPAFLTDCKLLEFLESVFHLFIPFWINEINCLQVFISSFFKSRLSLLKNDDLGTSLAIQWLGLSVFTAVAPDSIPGQGTKILQARPAQPLPPPPPRKSDILKQHVMQEPVTESIICHSCLTLNFFKSRFQLNILSKAWDTVSFSFSFRQAWRNPWRYPNRSLFLAVPTGTTSPGRAALEKSTVCKASGLPGGETRSHAVCFVFALLASPPFPFICCPQPQWELWDLPWLF